MTRCYYSICQQCIEQSCSWVIFSRQPSECTSTTSDISDPVSGIIGPGGNCSAAPPEFISVWSKVLAYAVPTMIGWILTLGFYGCLRLYRHLRARRAVLPPPNPEDHSVGESSESGTLMSYIDSVVSSTRTMIGDELPTNLPPSEFLARTTVPDEDRQRLRNLNIFARTQEALTNLFGQRSEVFVSGIMNPHFNYLNEMEPIEEVWFDAEDNSIPTENNSVIAEGQEHIKNLEIPDSANLVEQVEAQEIMNPEILDNADPGEQVEDQEMLNQLLPDQNPLAEAIVDVEQGEMDRPSPIIIPIPPPPVTFPEVAASRSERCRRLREHQVLMLDLARSGQFEEPLGLETEETSEKFAHFREDNHELI